MGGLTGSGYLAGVATLDGKVTPLAEMKVDELRELAVKMAIPGAAGMKKAELVAAIAATEVQYPVRMRLALPSRLPTPWPRRRQRQRHGDPLWRGGAVAPVHDPGRPAGQCGHHHRTAGRRRPDRRLPGGTLYPLPLAHVPSALVPICADIARHRLYGEQAPEQIAKRNEAALAFLKSVGKGSWRWGWRPTASRWRARTWPSCSPMAGSLAGELGLPMVPHA